MSEEASDSTILDELEKNAVVPASTASEELLRESITEQTADSMQRRMLRNRVSGGVGCLLLFEIVGLLAIVIMQGLGTLNLNEWVLGFFVNGVIIQTFASLHVIVTHLFPDGKLPKAK